MLLNDAIAAVRKGGKVLVFGLNEEARAEVPIVDIAYRELHVHGVYIGKGTFPLAIDLLDRNEIGFERLLTHSFEFARAMDAVDAARSRRGGQGAAGPGRVGGRRRRRAGPAQKLFGVSIQMYSVGPSATFSIRCGVVLGYQIESPGSRKWISSPTQTLSRPLRTIPHSSPSWVTGSSPSEAPGS